MDVLFLSEEAFEDALLAEDVSLGAAEGGNEGLQAETAHVEGLDRVSAQSFLLRPVAELPLLVVSEEREVVVVLGVPLRHLGKEALTWIRMGGGEDAGTNLK